jgi:hypothetical protein
MFGFIAPSAKRPNPLPPGIECERCNAYFGSKVEQIALSSFPFSLFRFAAQVPNKRGKAARLETDIGTLYAVGLIDEFCVCTCVVSRLRRLPGMATQG